MRYLLLALLLSMSSIASAEIVLRATSPNGDYIRLFSRQCSSTVIIAKIPPQYREQVHSGEASIGRKVYLMCWVLRPDGMVGMLYEDGDQGLVPASDFTSEINS